MINFTPSKTYFNIYKTELKEASETCWINNNIYLYIYILITNGEINRMLETSEHKLFQSTGGGSLRQTAPQQEDQGIQFVSLNFHMIPLVGGTHSV